MIHLLLTESPSAQPYAPKSALGIVPKPVAATPLLVVRPCSCPQLSVAKAVVAAGAAIATGATDRGAMQ